MAITAVFIDVATYVSLWVVHIRNLMILTPIPQLYFLLGGACSAAAQCWQQLLSPEVSRSDTRHHSW